MINGENQGQLSGFICVNQQMRGIQERNRLNSPMKKNNVGREYVHEYVCNVWGTGWRERLLEVAILTMKATLQQWRDPSTLAGVPEAWAQQKEQQGLLRRVEHLWTQQVLWHLSRRRSGHTKPLLLQHSFWESWKSCLRWLALLGKFQDRETIFCKSKSKLFMGIKTGLALLFTMISVCCALTKHLPFLTL